MDTTFSKIVFYVERDCQAMILSPKGYPHGSPGPDLRAELDQLHKLLDQPEIIDLVFDMGREPFCGSTIISAIIELGTHVHDHGGRVVLCNAPYHILKSLQVFDLDKLFPYYPTREAAFRLGLTTELQPTANAD